MSDLTFNKFNLIIENMVKERKWVTWMLFEIL